MNKTKSLKDLAHGALMMLMMLHFAFAMIQLVQIQPGGGVGLHIASANAQVLPSSTDLGIGGSDPFQKVGTKAQSMLTSATKVAIPLLAIAIFCLAIAMFKGRIDPNKAITMMAGGFIVGSAMAIATWIIS